MEAGGLLLSLARTSPESGGPWTAAFVAGFLARLLLEPPSDKLLEAVGRRPDPPLTHEALANGIETVVRLYRETGQTDLAREWTRLFVGPRGAPCRPWHDTWESEGPPRLRGPRHLSALRFWERAGLEPVNLETEPADHAGLILALVSALAARCAQGDVEALEILSEFWSAHVSVWMPRFASTLRAEARDGYHEAIGRLLTAAVESPS
jgi:TorA maturation chaperone TorD